MKDLSVSLQSKTTQNFIRLISIIKICFLSITLYRFIFVNSDTYILHEIQTNRITALILNGLSMFCFTVLLFLPTKILLISILSFFYGIEIFVNVPGNVVGVIMMFLCYYILITNRKLEKHKRIISIILLIASILAVLTQLRFEQSIFLNSIFKSFSTTLTILILLFFHKISSNPNKTEITDNKILNLRNYSFAKEQDARILNLILENKTYKEISMKVLRSEGTVRNRANELYTKMKVRDKTDFVRKYAGFKIVFEEDSE